MPSADQRRPHRLGETRERLTDNPHDRGVAPSKVPHTIQRLLVLLFIVLLCVVSGFILVERWRRATAVLGASLVYLALLRWVVDSRVLGVLAVRSRRFDSFFTVTVGAAMLWLAFSIDALTA